MEAREEAMGEPSERREEGRGGERRLAKVPTREEILKGTVGKVGKKKKSGKSADMPLRFVGSPRAL